jgi:hypothetical protein
MREKRRKVKGRNVIAAIEERQGLIIVARKYLQLLTKFLLSSNG